MTVNLGNFQSTLWLDYTVCSLDSYAKFREINFLSNKLHFIYLNGIAFGLVKEIFRISTLENMYVSWFHEIFCKISWKSKNDYCRGMIAGKLCEIGDYVIPVLIPVLRFQYRRIPNTGIENKSVFWKP